MNTVILHFHSFLDKTLFIIRNRIGASEIIAETPGSLTLEDNGEPWEKSCHVYIANRPSLY